MYRVTSSGLLFTDNCEYAAVPDGTFTHGKKPITHAFKLRNPDKDKWYVLAVGSDEEKQRWLAAFASERQKAAEQAAAGVVSLVHLAGSEHGASAATAQYVRKVQNRVQVRSKQDRIIVNRKASVMLPAPPQGT
jgi:hypothetical protein